LRDEFSLFFTGRERAPGTVTSDMEQLRERALRAGARGVISLGAGGGGFLLVYAPDPERTRSALEGAPELRFGLDAEGAVAVDSGRAAARGRGD
jgi:D-glycero-alpha-D-manno-heptose-7-phosphate kinase